MGKWLIVALVVLGVVGVWWERRRLQQRTLRRLVGLAAGDPRRARTTTFAVQGLAAVVAVLALAVALWAEQVHRAFWLRIPLALLVMAIYVPFAVQLAPVRVRLGRLRRTPQARLIDAGASEPVARAIARAGAPFALVGSLIFLAAVAVAAWHHVR